LLTDARAVGLTPRLLRASGPRSAGVEAASQALGHSDLSTTLGIYGHQDQRDLERAMEALARMREADSRDDDS
jgi:integrase